MIILNSEVIAKEVKQLNAPLKTELTLDIKASSANKFGFELKNQNGEIYQFGYDKEREILFSDRTSAQYV